MSVVVVSNGWTIAMVAVGMVVAIDVVVADLRCKRIMLDRLGSALLPALVGEVFVEVKVDHATDHVVPAARRDGTRDGEDAPEFIPLEW